MLPKQEVVAMILAGGQGSRLGVLTKKLAKPAVPYGGKYRIIDFPLSNCVNSGIETVGVLTQYQPLELNEYIGSGQPWDLDSMNAGVRVLPPYQRSRKSDWYKGTANAIYQNIPYIERYSPEYVVILSGDHIYKMDYSKMVAYHKEKNADCTIAVIEVPMAEAPRFGILNTNEDDSIYEFDEKPKKPKSNKASMGIYVFTWSKLKKYLEEDEATPKSSNDFGHDVLPAMLESGERMFAYPFEGYWKDVGTVESLWESNMDLLNPNVPLDLSEDTWKIYCRNPVMPPHYISKDAKVQNSLWQRVQMYMEKLTLLFSSPACTLRRVPWYVTLLLCPAHALRRARWCSTQSLQKTPLSAKTRWSASARRTWKIRTTGVLPWLAATA